MVNSNGFMADRSRRGAALWAGIGLLLMAVLGPLALFGVLESLVVPGDAPTTANNIAASEAIFRLGIVAFLGMAMLDVLVAWGLYIFFKPVNETLALLAAWLRLAYAAVLAVAVANLLDVVQLSAAPSAAQVMSSIDSFQNGWDIGLAIFGLHLLGLGFLVFGPSRWSRVLGVLVVIAGGGYVFDSIGTILVPGYDLTVSLVTFVGEALLIPWLIWVAFKGHRYSSSNELTDDGATAGQPAVSSGPVRA